MGGENALFLKLTACDSKEKPDDRAVNSFINKSIRIFRFHTEVNSTSYTKYSRGKIMVSCIIVKITLHYKWPKTFSSLDVGVIFLREHPGNELELACKLAHLCGLLVRTKKGATLCKH